MRLLPASKWEPHGARETPAQLSVFAFGFLACERIHKVTHFPGVPQNLLLSALHWGKTGSRWLRPWCYSILSPRGLVPLIMPSYGDPNYCKPVVTNCWSQTETYWSPLPRSLGISCSYHPEINHMLLWDICGFTWPFPWLFVPGWPIHLTYKGWGNSMSVFFHVLIQTRP